ncbi:uncharacterized protein LOC114286584 [Camellia sinensis]|uniref:uncharacterized protein LOC114286584 n=1 Tax=Camellia sinensis TaxID=4442 RepID=UPI0010360AD5|nr:uncharacterized protein LOC114286584 [Camellia sinensis]
METVFIGASATGKHHWTPGEKLPEAADDSSDSGKKRETPSSSVSKSKKATSGASVIAENMNTLTNVVRTKNQQVTVRHLTGNESLFTISECMHHLTGITSLVGMPFFHFASTLMDNADLREDCIGVIDGTHVSAWVTVLDAATYFGRKYCHTQNIMAAVDFDMCFIFISCGWEGSMHDSHIFNEIPNDNVPFPHPDEGKYYLVDSGYPNRTGYLAPFKGHRYYQQEFRRIARNRTANTPRELFNKVHSSLRSVVERTFGNPTTVHPICDEEEAMTIVNAIPEVEHDEDGLMVGDEDSHMALVRLHIRDKLCYMRNNGVLGNI